MTQSVLLQPAYVLHSRPYRDTSLLIEMLTRDYGRICLLARGARIVKMGFRSRFKSLLQAFIPLLVSWRGKTDLMNLIDAESNGLAPNLTGQILLCGLYLNELLLRLLHRHDAYPTLFQAYQKSLYTLPYQPQLSLRRFEKNLLTELGYALQLHQEVKSGRPIDPDQFYRFDPVQGLLSRQEVVGDPSSFRGIALLALDQEQFSGPNDLQEAKRLLRLAIDYLLAGKKIHSRELLLAKTPY